MTNATPRFNRRASFVIGLTTQSGLTLLASDVLSAAATTLSCHGIDCFSVAEGQGSWKGTLEGNLTVSVLVDCNDRDGETFLGKVPEIAELLARHCSQECVLWSIDSLVAGLSFS